MNIIQSDIKTMSSREIAGLTGKQHSKVMSVIIDLSEKGIAKSATPAKWLNKQNNQCYTEYLLDKRDSLVLVARLSPEFTAAIVDRWQEPESSQTPQIPQTYAAALLEAGRLAQIVDEQAEKLVIAAPKVEYHDKVLASDNGLHATQVGSKHGLSAVKLNSFLKEIGGVYNQSVKRAKVFTTDFVKKGYGENKKTESGYDQPLFTNAGEIWINEQLINEGIV